MPAMPTSAHIGWGLALGLGLLNLGLAVALPRPLADTTYVLTPMVDVVPGTVRLSEQEGQRLVAAVRDEAEARNMQQAYAMLGSTLSFDDLLRGVAALQDLGPEQRAELTRLLEGGRADREALLDVQRRILAAEGHLLREARELRRHLPGGGP